MQVGDILYYRDGNGEIDSAPISGFGEQWVYLEGVREPFYTNEVFESASQLHQQKGTL